MHTEPTKQLPVNNLVEAEISLIKNIYEYDPKALATSVLQDDFRIALAWWSTKKSGGDIKYSFEEIENLLQLIIEELQRRGVQFHPDKMQPNSKEIFEKIVSRIEKNLDEKYIPSFEKNFETAVIIKDFINIVGSSIENKDFKDIDLLVRLANPTDFIKRAVETRVSKMNSLDKDLHFIWGDSEGPHDNYMPLYDLVLVKREPEIIKMAKEINLLAPLQPMKPSKKFYDIKEAANYLFGG
jgi:hypothetical protein